MSRDGGETFSTEQLAGPVDIRQAPQVLAPEKLGGDFYFLGDYDGLEPMGSGFAALFALPNPGRHDRADVFFARSSEQA